MKLSNAALGLAAVGAGLVVARGAGLMVARMLGRGRGDAVPAGEPPAPEQLIGAPRSHLSAMDAAQAFQTEPERRH